MLVPLTDRDNPHAKLMLELIADQTPFPRSAFPRSETEMVNAGRSGRYVARVLVGLIGIFLAAVVFGAVRALQS
jgi:hypothetical protein